MLLGTRFGVVGHARAEAGVGLFARVQPPPISRPVAFLGLLLIGLSWGGLASGFLRSALLGGAALVGAVAVEGLWRRFVLGRPVSPGDLVFACVAPLSGFGLGLLLKALQV